MSSVTFSTAVGGDGSTVTDDNNATTGLREGGWKTRFVPCFTQQVAVANYVVSAATSALGGATTNSTSTTSLAIGTGSKSLTLVESGKAYIIGQYVVIASTASPSNNMVGQITSFSGTSLVVNVTTINGSGTISAWSISVTSVGSYLPLAGGTMTGVLEQATGSAILSAATINLDTATGNRVHITGTTTITAVTLTRGPRTVIFDGILTLTHHATTNNLPSAANITTAAGDRAIYESDGTTVYCVSYVPVSGKAVINPIATATVAGLVPTPPNNTTTFLRGDATFATVAAGFTLGTPVATTSGTGVTFTGIPSGTKQVAVMFSGISANGTEVLCVRIGSSAGIETANYDVAYTRLTTSASGNQSTSKFDVGLLGTTTNCRGTLLLTLENSSSNTWVGTFISTNAGPAEVRLGSGTKSLSGALERIKIYGQDEVVTFTAGEVNIAYI